MITAEQGDAIQVISKRIVREQLSLIHEEWRRKVVALERWVDELTAEVTDLKRRVKNSEVDIDEIQRNKQDSQ